MAGTSRSVLERGEQNGAPDRLHSEANLLLTWTNPGLRSQKPVGILNFRGKKRCVDVQAGESSIGAPGIVNGKKKKQQRTQCSVRYRDGGV